jgi:hypothetical protein
MSNKETARKAWEQEWDEACVKIDKAVTELEAARRKQARRTRWTLTRLGRDLGIAALALTLLLIGFAFGMAMPFDPPLCQEDEVILYTGACYPLDNSTYEPGIGWVRAL